MVLCEHLEIALSLESKRQFTVSLRYQFGISLVSVWYQLDNAL
ncbi:hypothetical protein PCIT_a1835 [Pseudoalteromonas citrea]|uniref:Uncharacterized protein n=1 Tax=Pseudoalteromonas citrea TaxID=43655 RepID=A0AAD4FS33_9GAMM|nr:hypothetical protein PCIT_a1835 [Pseudoalteromonas citrea]